MHTSTVTGGRAMARTDAYRMQQRMKQTNQVRTTIAILLVIGLAVIVTALSLRQAQGPWFRPITLTDFGVLAAMLALVIVMDLVQISLPQSKFSVAFTVSGTVFVAATIAYGAIFGVALAAIGTLVTELFLKKQLRKLTFNAAQYVCAAGLAGLMYHSIVRTNFRPPLSSVGTIVIALLAAAVYLFINAALVSTIVAIDIGKSPVQVFMANIPGLLMQNITLFSIGLLVTTVRM